MNINAVTWVTVHDLVLAFVERDLVVACDLVVAYEFMIGV